MPGRSMGTAVPRSQSSAGRPNFSPNQSGAGIGRNPGGSLIGRGQGNPAQGSSVGRGFGGNNAGMTPRNFGPNNGNNRGPGGPQSGFSNRGPSSLNNGGINNNRSLGQNFNGNRGGNFNRPGPGGPSNLNRGFNRGPGGNRWGPGAGFGHRGGFGPRGWVGGYRGPSSMWRRPFYPGVCGPSFFLNRWCGPAYRPFWGTGFFLGGAITYIDSGPVVYGYPVTYLDDVTYVNTGAYVDTGAVVDTGVYVDDYAQYGAVQPQVVQQGIGPNELVEIPTQPQNQTGYAPMTAEPIQAQPAQTNPQAVAPQGNASDQQSASDIALGWGDQAFNQGNYQEARNQYARAILAEQNDPRGHIAMGLTLFALGDFSEAGKALRNGITLAPALAEGGFDLSQAYGKREDMLRHIDAVNQYLRSNPDDMNALFVAGFTQIFGGDPVNGKAAFESYKSRGDADPKMTAFIDAAIRLAR